MFVGLRWYHWLGVAALLDAAFAWSYLMARAGEPQSAWLWHQLFDAIKVCQ